MKADKPSNKADDKRGRFMKSGYYDASDLLEQADKAYDQSIDEETLSKQRKRDWLFILIGVPAFIGFIYLIVMIFRGA